MKEFWNSVQFVFAAVGGWLGWFLGGCDGLIYALYGTASGGARSGLGTEAFHSDYAKEGSRRDEMRVELTFSNADRRYAIVRRMYWGKKGEAKAPVKESLLTEDGSTIVQSRGREPRTPYTAAWPGRWHPPGSPARWTAGCG